MANRCRLRMVVCGACLLWLALVAGQPLVRAAQADAPAAEEKSAEPDQAAPGGLSAQQEQVAERFRELEKLLLRMAELTAPTDPRRAALLRQAVAASKQRDIEHQFSVLVDLLKQERLSAVVKNQTEVQQDLNKLLELLLSEDRSKRIESEKERVREYLKRVNKLIKTQKGLQGETSRGGDERKIADKQGELADKTEELSKDLADDARKTPFGKSPEDGDKHGDEDQQPQPGEPKQEGDQKDSPREPGDKSQPGEDSDGKSDGKSAKGEKSDQDKRDQSDEKSDDKKSDDKKSDDKKSDDKKSKKDDQDQKSGDENKGDKQDKKADAEKPDGEKSDKEKPGGKESDGKPKEGGDAKSPMAPQDVPPPSDQEPGGEPSGDSPPPEDNPAQQRIEQAQRRMKEAQQKLEEAKRQDATEKQAEAVKELEQAKADLEEILRQLREEEMSRTLAMLESRFRKMLEQQIEVYEGTKRLDQVPMAERDRDDEIEAGRLSRKEAQISAEAEKALIVLEEEGSAVAFPAAVIEMRDDMEQVVRRLAQSKVGEVTQGIESDIIAALEEMIASLQKAQKKMEDNKQQDPGKMQQSGESEQPLVDTISELKMIRALQMRVNLRTKRYAELTKTEQAADPELVDALKRLAEREQRIHRVTRDIVVGKNK